MVSFTVAAEDLDPIALFEGAAILTRERALWSAPGGTMAMVALGAAAVLEAGPGVAAESEAAGAGPAGPLAAIAPALASAWQALCEGALIDAPHGVWGTGPVVVGGFAFDPQEPADLLWAGFPAARFVLPELLVTRTGGETWLTFNRVVVPGVGTEAGTAAGTSAADGAGEGAGWIFPGGIRLHVPAAATTAAGERGRRWLSLLAVASTAGRRPGSRGTDPREPAGAPGAGGPGKAAAAAGGPAGSRPAGAGGLGAEPGAPGPRCEAGGRGGPGSSARPSGAGGAPSLIGARAVPGREAWEAMVRAALDAIGRGELAKVVLARRLHLRAGAAFDPGAALRRLQAGYPECFVFAVARDRTVFLGATPERLVRLRDRRVETAAVAGSTARGATPEADAALARELLASPKEREEHALVVRMLRDTLGPVCRVLDVPAEPRLLQLQNVQHLYTPITGVVDGATVPELVARLHPTPALGGWPRERALEFIRRWEGRTRGWYAAPLGWFDHRGEGEMAVAIRSGVVRGTEAWLFAGCGVVAGSDPGREWQETALKLQPLAAALGVEPGATEVDHGG
ncbi:isochorismate synthase MenF [Thermaerobacter sp. PB12/4term]|uniref:isochorismate synthase n=1 Tax=Thermaerobacter sp. PB12/4term TaxID=2293838 RepID=UPI001FAB76C4|nr:isochorismate synthase [Thermaerobacter sp. PB12/4term]